MHRLKRGFGNGKLGNGAFGGGVKGAFGQERTLINLICAAVRLSLCCHSYLPKHVIREITEE